MRPLGKISNLFIYFFMKRFYIQKKYKMQTSDFHSDTFIHLKRDKKIGGFLCLRCF